MGQGDQGPLHQRGQHADGCRPTHNGADVDVDAEALIGLTADQVVRVQSFGARHRMTAGQVLFGPRHPTQDFFVIESGTVEVERPATTDAPATLLATHGPGDFLGELNLLTGQTTYLTARVKRSGRVTVLGADAFARLMRQDADVSTQVLRTFMARRALLRSGEGARSVQILGSRWCSASTTLRSWASRQQVPHVFVDIDTPKGDMLASLVGANVLELPIVLALGRVERNSTPTALAQLLGLGPRPDDGHSVRDLVIIGGGPAGLATAVCGASEGLDVLLLEGRAVGGQAADSARIENYVGFPSGISGGELTSRAMVQAQKFGATVYSPCRVSALERGDGHLEVTLAGGSKVRSRTVVIASGAHYNTLPLPNWQQYEGTSIFYAATELEARACSPAPVVIVGGANSSGQAAIFMADHGSKVNLVVRGTDLATRMSRYLVGRVEAHPNITVFTETTVTQLHGPDALEAVTLASPQGTIVRIPCAALFCFIGASPDTEFIDSAARDNHRFLRTDRELRPEDLDVEWALLGRDPLPYETNVPGLFVVGDARSGSVKRVAAAVGEGSAVIASVHAALAPAGNLKVTAAAQP